MVRKREPIRILYSKYLEMRGNKFIDEDISSEPVEIIKSEDIKLKK